VRRNLDAWRARVDWGALRQRVQGRERQGREADGASATLTECGPRVDEALGCEVLRLDRTRLQRSYEPAHVVGHVGAAQPFEIGFDLGLG
jgi:hypothetical protein